VAVGLRDLPGEACGADTDNVARAAQAGSSSMLLLELFVEVPAASHLAGVAVGLRDLPGEACGADTDNVARAAQAGSSSMLLDCKLFSSLQRTLRLLSGARVCLYFVGRVRLVECRDRLASVQVDVLGLALLGLFAIGATPSSCAHD